MKRKIRYWLYLARPGLPIAIIGAIASVLLLYMGLGLTALIVTFFVGLYIGRRYF